MSLRYIEIAKKPDFQEFVTDLMLRMGLKHTDIEIIFPIVNVTDSVEQKEIKEAQCRMNFGEFGKCMVSKLVDVNFNYEVYELAGDACINTSLVMYLFQKINAATESRRERDRKKGILFIPKANVTDYFNKLKAEVVHNKEFHDIAGRLGFGDYLEMGVQNSSTKNFDPIKILADSLEAFIGCFEVMCSRYLAHHYSHSYVSNFVDYIMNSRKVNYHPVFLYDDITLLKETNDIFRYKSLPQYVLEYDGEKTVLRYKIPKKIAKQMGAFKVEYVNVGNINAVGSNYGPLKGNVEMSTRALDYLKKRANDYTEGDKIQPNGIDRDNVFLLSDIKRAPAPEDFGIEDLVKDTM